MEDIEPLSDEDISTPERDAVTPNERLHWHLTNALVSAESPETTAHLRGALSVYQDLPPTPLVECPLCGKVGLPERIRTHECQ
ncbi:hypothetical protein [Haloferax sulfurifontis]|uniref:hypothetical protein n=1 Tax=Haloferax sulfurifontis TaxID=255616 RepID=UPI000A033DC1|nr:hypothetical protein [Haloferax sulfurifontis]